jgi:type I restriction enzyme M protein
MRHEMTLKSEREGDWCFQREIVEVVRGGKAQQRYTRTNGTIHQGQADGDDSVAVDPTTSMMLYVRQIAHFNLGKKAVLPIVRAIRPVPELMRQPHPPSDTTRLAENGHNIATVIQSLTANERERVVAAMSRVVPGLTDVQAVSAGRYVTLVFTQDQGPQRRPEFASTEMSDGALRALAVVVAATQMTKNELLVIEEPEVNLHPGAADVVYDVLHRASERGAVLLTTHSPELLDRAGTDQILVCEYVDGVTLVGPLSEQQRSIVRDGLFSTAELMRSEELRREGAAPRVVRD